MRTRLFATVSAMAIIVIALGVVGWTISNTGPGTVLAQEGDSTSPTDETTTTTPAPSPTPEPSEGTVTTVEPVDPLDDHPAEEKAILQEETWGTISISPGEVIQVAHQTSGQTSGRSATERALTPSDVNRRHGKAEIKVLPSLTNHIEGTTYRVDRQLADVVNPQSGWRHLDTLTANEIYEDYDVAPNTDYWYRIVGTTPDGTQVGSVTTKYKTRALSYLDGYPVEGNVNDVISRYVVLYVRPLATYAFASQHVTVM